MLEIYLLDKYGPRISIDQLAVLLHWSEQGLRNAVSAGRFPMNTYNQNGDRYADYRDVARYLDACREQAELEAAKTNA